MGCGYNAQGSVTETSNPASAKLNSYTYDSFGNIITSTGTVANNRNFLTKEQDVTGLIYFGKRYYDPKIGRFITPDPMGMIDGPNMYLYCNNDPVNFVDLWGLYPEKADPWGLSKKDPFATFYTRGPQGWVDNYGNQVSWEDLAAGAQWLWRHGYIDVGYTGLTPGKLGGILNTGFIIAPSGIYYYYYGVGIGGGGGVTATVNLGRPPSSSESIVFVGRYGSGIWGVKGTTGFSENNPTGSIGAGWGIGAGSGIVVKHTIQLIEW